MNSLGSFLTLDCKSSFIPYNFENNIVKMGRLISLFSKINHVMHREKLFSSTSQKVTSTTQAKGNKLVCEIRVKLFCKDFFSPSFVVVAVAAVVVVVVVVTSKERKNV